MAVTKKSAATTIVKTKVIAKTPPVKKAAVKNEEKVIPAQASREDHFNRIQKEAYFLAEKAGFKGDPSKYWLAAEANVRRTGL